jgi:RNA polymerase sigma-70 factor (ECF subfamily)
MSLGEKQILNVLMEWRVRLTGVAMSVLRDSHLCEDVYQNLLLKALKGDAVFENERALISWSVVTIRRESIDVVRKRRRELMLLDEDVMDLLDRQMAASPVRDENIRRDALESCLRKLPEKSSAVLHLRYFYGYSCDEVARRSNMSLDAIYKLISRIHLGLKKCITSKLGSGST